MEVPGKTITVGDPDNLSPAVINRQLFPRAVRRTVVITSSGVSDNSVFSNGLFQNIYFIYLMLETMGYNPILLVNERKAETPEFMKGIRVKLMDEIVREPFPVLAYIEIGMSLDPALRAIFKKLGAKTIKIYLGNILNIDVETPMFYPGINFSHHVVGEMDEIWVSPHYEMHREYAGVLNRVPVANTKIAPYIWEPLFLTNFGRRQPMWKPPTAGEPTVILIMEPNISFQKSSLVPLLIADAYARMRTDWNYKIVVVNGDRILQNPYAQNAVLPRLDSFRNGKMELISRLDMRTAMERYPSAIPICHHYNNEYNYMLFEYFYGGWPVIHNAKSWSGAGYFYEEEDINRGIQQLDFAVRYHEETLQTFITQGKAILWRYSMHNPAVQDAWYKLLGGKEKAFNAST
jgi:hypothetical protein